MKFDMNIFGKSVEKIQVSLRSEKNKGNLRRDQNTISIISRSFLLRMKNVWSKVIEKLKTRIMSNNCFFENRAVYELMWKNVVERGRLQMAIWRLRVACWIPKATNLHSQHIIFIAFPLQQWFHERASILRYTNIACLLMLHSYFAIKQCLLRS